MYGILLLFKERYDKFFSNANVIIKLTFANKLNYIRK